MAYAGRSFRKNPGFTATALVTLTLGLGANATIFSFVDASALANWEFERHSAPLARSYCYWRCGARWDWPREAWRWGWRRFIGAARS